MVMAEHNLESCEYYQFESFLSSAFTEEDQVSEDESEVDSEFETELGCEQQWTSALKKNEDEKAKKKSQVCLEGVVDGSCDDDLPRTKSLTDEDLDELKGCVDLGFGFSYEEIPELCNTLPALELCYSMSQKFLDETNSKPACSSSDTASTAGSDSPSPVVANWKISSPGDHPEDVKARLKFWAQAVACTVKLCS
ncbi:hypothetical protein V2J09_005658 [Rumex salicifolius]